MAALAVFTAFLLLRPCRSGPTRWTTRSSPPVRPEPRRARRAGGTRESAEGFSNPVWTLFGAGLVSVPRCSVCARWPPGGGACGFATFGLGRQLGLGARTSLAPPSSPPTRPWPSGPAGLETASFTLLLVLAVWRFEVEQGRTEAHPPVLPVLVWASRPEAPAYLLYFALRRGVRLAAPPLGPRDLRWALLAGLPIGAYEVGGLVVYGGLLPATHAAKVGGGPPLVEALTAGRGERFLLHRFLFHQGWGFAAMWLAGALCALVGRRRVPLAAWCMGFSGLLFVAYAFTDWMPRYRFLVPPPPFLALALRRPAGALQRLRGTPRTLAVATSPPGARRGMGSGHLWRDRAHNIALAVDAAPGHSRSSSGRGPRGTGRQADAWAVLEWTDPSEPSRALTSASSSPSAGSIWDTGPGTPSAASSTCPGTTREGSGSRRHAR